MDFTAHRVLLLISLLSILSGCSRYVPEPKKAFNIAELAVRKENGVIILDGEPFSGRLYALSNRDTIFIREYSEGLEDGLHKLWFPNKQIAEIRYYRKGKKTGLHTGFWDNGQKKYQYTFSEDLYEDMQYEWYSTGQAFSKKEYKQGHENGLQQVWSLDGKIKSNYEAKNGRNYGNIGKKNCLSEI
ncbi:MAG: hypothetical protein V4721_12600 [Bacteroidota bacterium]